FKSFRMAIPVWLGEKLFQRSLLRRELRKFCKSFDGAKRLLFCEHHLSHAASAFYPSPFDNAVVLTMGRCRRMGHDHGRLGERSPPGDFLGVSFPSFAR